MLRLRGTESQIAKNRTILEQSEAGNTDGGDVFPQTQSEIEHLKAQIAQIRVDRRCQREDAGLILQIQSAVQRPAPQMRNSPSTEGQC